MPEARPPLSARPLVTALVTNHDYAGLLPNAIDSALLQTHASLEVVVVDDGSTDASRDVLRAYGGRVRAILRDHAGQAAALNAGFAEARGEVVCLLDADDLWRPEKVERVLEVHREGYGFVCHDLEAVGLAAPGGERPHLLAPSGLRRGRILHELLVGGCGWPFTATSAMSIRSDLARRLLPLPEADWPIAADNPLAYGAACLADVAIIGDVLGTYRLHESNRYMGHAAQVPWVARIRAVEDPARRLAYVSELARRLGVELPRVDLRDRYAYCREWSFLTRPLPLLDLPRLWRGLYRERRAAAAPIGATLRSLAWDALAAAGLSLGLPSPWRELRRRYAYRRASNPGTLPPPLARL